MARPRAQLDDVIASARNLSARDRDRLLEEITYELGPPPGFKNAGAEEIDRRMAEGRSGKVRMIPWAETKARVDQVLRTLRRR